MLRKYFLFTISLLISAFSICHGALPPPRPEIFLFETRYLPYSSVKNYSAGEVQPQTFKLLANLKPLLSKDHKNFVSFGLAYDNYHFNYRNWDAIGDQTTVDTVHSIGIPIFFRHKMKSPQWTTLVFVTPGVASDFRGSASKGFTLQGGVVFDRHWNERRLGFGLVAINNFGQPRVLPAVSYEETFHERHRVRVRAPVDISYFYRATDTLELGIVSRTQGTHARIGEDGTYHDKYLNYSLSTFGPSVLWNVTKSLTLTFDTGIVYRHKLNINNDRHEFRNFDLKDSGYLTAGLRIRL